MGLSKREPINEREEVEKIIRTLLTRRFTNTAQKFKFQQLTARFNSYKQYWSRILRKIEDGTYERDRFKMALKDKSAPPKEETKRAVKEKTVDEHKKLFDSLVEAKKKCSENTSGLQYDNFQKMVKEQGEKLKSKYNCNKVEFKIVVDDGKAKLKAIPKK
jgi:hypothetical protein